MMQPLQVLQVLTDTEDVEQLLDVVFVLNSVSQLFSPTTRENHFYNYKIYLTKEDLKLNLENRKLNLENW